ncbi:MAG: AAC(3) family N-acetyltransferase [Candidatus Cloacimonetes bacterium]|nr:AAC(3) family N-acetyltransferase [Candidatus Cloacimonadota bacterium]
MSNTRGRTVQSIKKAMPWLHTAYRKIKYKKTKVILEEIVDILINKLQITYGDTLIVHTSLSRFQLTNALPEDVYYVLQKCVGAKGNILMPTFIPVKHLLSTEPYYAGNVPGHNGLINELFRMEPSVLCSTHPWKPIAVWGADAQELISEHHLSERAFDKHSPYYKAMALGAKIIGIGTSFQYLSFAHVIEDVHPELFPPIYTEPIDKICYSVNGEKIAARFGHILPIAQKHHSFENIRKHIDDSFAREFKYREIYFSIADSKKLYMRMLELAQQGITIYGDYKKQQGL